MVDLKRLIGKMTIEEKTGQLVQYNANVFLDTDAEVTGPISSAGLKEDDVKNIGSLANISSIPEKPIPVRVLICRAYRMSLRRK